MSRWQKILDRLLSGQADANCRFEDVRGLLLRLGYSETIRGDHHIFRKVEQPEIINIQPLKNGKAKAYQMRQIRDMLHRYGQTTVN